MDGFGVYNGLSVMVALRMQETLTQEISNFSLFWCESHYFQNEQFYCAQPRVWVIDAKGL